jgi:Cft2 family RNA processing exonuclease
VCVCVSCVAVYQTYIGAMNENIRRQIAISNPFVFKHISNLKSIDQFDDVGPCVIMASPLTFLMLVCVGPVIMLVAALLPRA